MMRKMRRMTEEEGLRRGRPILIAARGINDPEYSLAYGLDFETWLEGDLIDIVMPVHIGIPRGEHLGSLQAFYELAHRYNAPAYPCLRFHVNQHSWPECRAEAMSRFAEGADGITTFNRFDPHHHRWHELGDSQVLRDRDKTYTCPQYLPVTVTDKGGGPMRLLVGEDVRSAPPKNKTRSIKLRMHVIGLTAKHGLQLQLNRKPLELAPGSPKAGDAPQDFWLEFTPGSSMFQVPENLLTARVNQIDGTLMIDDVQLDVHVSE